MTTFNIALTEFMCLGLPGLTGALTDEKNKRCLTVYTILFKHCYQETVAIPSLHYLRLSFTPQFCRVSNRRPMEPFLNKTYVLVHSENMDTIMKAMGVNYLVMKAVNKVRPTIRLTRENDVYTITTMTALKNIYTRFRLGEEYVEDTFLCKEMDAVATVKGNVLTHIYRKNGKTVRLDREYSQDGVKITYTLDDMVAVRTYKAV